MNPFFLFLVWIVAALTAFRPAPASAQAEQLPPAVVPGAAAHTAKMTRQTQLFC